MPRTETVIYGQIYRLLLDLGFVEESVKGPHLAFLHSDSETVILFAEHRQERDPVTDEDQASVRRHLVENGLVSEKAIARFLETPSSVLD